MGLLSRLFRRPATTGFRNARPRPDTAFFAIGDVHGRDDLLEALLARLAARDPEAKIVCAGDYVDRGPDSASALARLYDRQMSGGDSFVCLAGNHEEMLLTFLDEPMRAGPAWLHNGGGATLESFGITGVTPDTAPEDFQQVADWLAQRIGPARLDWLRHMPRLWQSGNVAVVHAGADPALPLEQQSRRSLLWGHPDFLRVPRGDGLWIVHGHTITDEPRMAQGRIAIDTGAYRSGRLTAVHVAAGGVEFISTTPPHLPDR